MTSEFRVPPQIAAAVEQGIRYVHDGIPGVLGCVVATVDGRLVQSLANTSAEPKRIAAMIGSIVALGRTIGKEVRLGDCQYVAVNAAEGTLLMQQIPSRKPLLVVATVARSTTNLGIVLHATRHVAGEIGQVLDRWLDQN